MQSPSKEDFVDQTCTFWKLLLPMKARESLDFKERRHSMLPANMKKHTTKGIKWYPKSKEWVNAIYRPKRMWAVRFWQQALNNMQTTTLNWQNDLQVMKRMWAVRLWPQTLNNIQTTTSHWQNDQQVMFSPVIWWSSPLTGSLFVGVGHK